MSTNHFGRVQIIWTLQKHFGPIEGQGISQLSNVTHLTIQFKAHGDHHSSHERQNAFNRITLDRRDERPIALPQLEPPDGGGSTGNGSGDEEQEKDLVSRVQSLETRIAKLEDRLGKRPILACE